MSDSTANLEFFKLAILEPALQAQSYLDFQGHVSGSEGRSFVSKGSPVSDFGAIEAAHWAWLGVRIGYFDGKAAQELISSSAGVFKAWSNLQSRQIIPPDDDWARVIRLEERGQDGLNEGLFSAASEIASQTRELLQNTFQTFLLLTAESILDAQSRYFLDSIAWTEDKEWTARRKGAVHEFGSVQDIGSGFANVLNYWEAMDSLSSSTENHCGDEAAARFFTRRTEIKISFSKGFATGNVGRAFCEDARAIVSRRFNLGRTEIVDRYFVLAGEFVNCAKDDSPEWFDARLKIFDKLRLLIKYAGGGAYTIGANRPLLWNSFTRGIESPVRGNEIRPRESPRGRTTEESV